MLRKARPSRILNRISRNPKARDVGVEKPRALPPSIGVERPLAPPPSIAYFTMGKERTPGETSGIEMMDTEGEVGDSGSYGRVVDPHNINQLGITYSEGVNDVLGELDDGKLGLLDLVEQQAVKTSETGIAPVEKCKRNDYGIETEDPAAFEAVDLRVASLPYGT